MKQREIAEKLSITPGMVSHIMAGRKRLSWEKAELAGRLFDVDPKIFLRRNTTAIRKAFSGRRGISKKRG